MEKRRDQQVLAQIAAGDAKGLETLMRKYEPKVYRFVLRFVKDPALAEEIAQDIFMRIWENRAKLLEVETFHAWLFRVTRNRALTAIQEASARTLREETYAAEVDWFTDGNDVIDERDFQELLRHLTEQLPPRCKEVFLLKRDLGLTNEEIGDRLQISTNTVKNQLKKSYSILRKLVAEHAYLLIITLLSQR